MLYGYGESADVFRQLDRPILSKHLQILASLCGDFQTILSSRLSFLRRQSLITPLAVSRASFETQTTYYINTFTNRLLLDYGRTWQYILAIFDANLHATTFNTDWSLEPGNLSNGYLIRNVPVTFPNSSCNCVVSGECQRPLRIGPVNMILPGLFVGCTPLHGLHISTLECFFSSDCIANIVNHLGYLTHADGNPPSNFSFSRNAPVVIAALNSSLQSRYLPTTPIGQLISEMVVEEWMISSSYETYFNICAPSFCRYEYATRKSVFFVVASLLGIYGGLTVGLRLAVWNGALLYRSLYRRCRTRSTAVQPFDGTIVVKSRT